MAAFSSAFILITLTLSLQTSALTMSSWEASLKDIIVKNKRVVESKYITFTTISEGGWPAARTVVFRGFHNQDDKVYLKFISDSRSQKMTDIDKCSKVELCWYLTKNKDQFRIKGYATNIGIKSTDEKNLKLRIQSWNGLSDGARAPFFFPGEPGQEVIELGNIPTQPIQKDVLDVDDRNDSEEKEAEGRLKQLELESTAYSKSDITIDDNSPPETIFNQKKNKKFIPIIPDAETVRALRAERKTGEEEPSKSVLPPPDCFNIILVDPIIVDHLQLGGNGHGQSRYMHTLKTEGEGEGGGRFKSSWVTKKLNP